MVSILVPSYNHAPYLPECLKSVQAQTLQDWEMVLVDDGSRDGSVEIARSFAAEDHRIQVFVNDENLGTYGTLQAALGRASGTYAAVLNSDDLWLPDKLERQIRLLERDSDVSFSYTLGWMVNEQGQTDESEDVHADWPQEERQDPLPHLLSENRILASSVVFRREGLRFNTTCRYSGDWVALLEQSFRGPAQCISDRLTFWRQHPANTYRRSPAQVLEEIALRRAIRERTSDWLRGLDAQAALRGLARNELNLHALYVLCGAIQPARDAIRRARKLDPLSKAIRRRLLLSLLPLAAQRRRLWKEEALDLDPRVADSREPIVLSLARP